MQQIDFDTITKPTPAAYNAANPTEQQENFYYRMNQLFDQISGEMNIDLAEEISGLAMEGSTVEIPGFIRMSRHGRTVSFTFSS